MRRVPVVMTDALLGLLFSEDQTLGGPHVGKVGYVPMEFCKNN